MKKGICLGCLPGSTLEAKLRLAKDAGFDGVEPGSMDSDEKVLELKKAADSAGLGIASIMSGKHWSHPLSSPDPAVRKVCNETVRRDLRHARMMGASAVLLVPGVVNDEVTYEKAWERSLAEIKDIAKAAEQEKVYVAIENVWNKFLLSPIEFKQFIKEANSPFVKAYFDCGNILFYGYPQHWLRTLGSLVVKIHVKGFNNYPKVAFTRSLKSDVPWKAVRQALTDIGYQDYVTVEIGPDPEDPEGSIKGYSKELDKILAGEL